MSSEITIVKEFGFMNNEEFTCKLAFAILPGLMSRYKEQGYSDLSAIGEAFNLSNWYFDSIKTPNSEITKSLATYRQQLQAKIDECSSEAVAYLHVGRPDLVESIVIPKLQQLLAF